MRKVIASFAFLSATAWSTPQQIFEFEGDDLVEIGAFNDFNEFTFAAPSSQRCEWKTVWNGRQYVRMRVCQSTPGPSPNPPASPTACHWVTTFDYSTGRYVRVRVCP